MDIQKEKDAYLSELIAREAISKDEFDNIIFRPSINAFRSIHLTARFIDNINWGWESWQAAKAQMTGQKFFSHDFNGDGFQYHDTLQEAKEAAEADLDIYRDRVADGTHIANMGEFYELCYGIVIGSAEYSVDCVVSADHHKNDEYTQYSVGTEILSLYLDEAQEPSND